MHDFAIQQALKQLASVTALGLAAASPSARAAEAAGPPPPPKWETRAGLGATLTSGNSESILVTANLFTQLKQEKNEYRAGVDVGYGEAKPQPSNANPDPDLEKNTDFIRGIAQWNHMVKDKFYSYVRADALRDDIAHVTYRVALSPGAGYSFVKSPTLTLGAELGPGYVFEKLEDDTNDYASLRAAERLEYKLSPTARLWQSLEWIPEVTHFENSLFNFQLGVQADLTKKLGLQLVFSDTYDSQPAQNSLGEDLERNDLRLVAGLTYKF